MRLTLELDEKQTKVFQDLLDTTLKSLVFQETVVQEEIKNFLPQECGVNEKEEQQQLYLQDYLAKITPQRILLAEILHTVNEADKKTSIISADASDLRQLTKRR